MKLLKAWGRLGKFVLRLTVNADLIDRVLEGSITRPQDIAKTLVTEAFDEAIHKHEAKKYVEKPIEVVFMDANEVQMHAIEIMQSWHRKPVLDRKGRRYTCSRQDKANRYIYRELSS